MLNQKEIIEVCKSYDKYRSLRKVSSILKISPNTVNKYVSRHYTVKRHYVVKGLHSKDNRLIGLYVGLWLGDGTQYKDKNPDGFYRYVVKICCHKQNHLLNKFIQLVILELFNKTSKLYTESNNNRAVVKFQSKFIYNFIYQYIDKDFGKKTATVRLKSNIGNYSNEFLEGVLLGLTLSDGYLKKNFMFNVISEHLSNNMRNILVKFNFKPSYYRHNRSKYGWKDLHMLKLNRLESVRIQALLNEIIMSLGFNDSFSDLKYGPAQI